MFVYLYPSLPHSAGWKLACFCSCDCSLGMSTEPLFRSLTAWAQRFEGIPSLEETVVMAGNMHFPPWIV